MTGAGGFVGRRVVDHLLARGESVIGIGRSEAPAGWPTTAPWVQADLLDPSAYSQTLQGADAVIHCAALTGKASPAALRKGNVDTTRALIGACTGASVKRLVFVSSIAAVFADRRAYAYAEAKIEAEALVRAAPLETVIVRPTMILGAGSPIQATLERLARLPVTPMFGDGERQVEAVDVEDVARLLAALPRDAEAADAVFALGGGERLSLRQLLARLRALQGIARPARFMSLPLNFTRSCLSLLEGPLLPLLPLTAGQLATFANDSLAPPNPIVERLAPNRRPSPPRAGEQAPPTPPPREDDTTLEREFTQLARYVAGQSATAYQTAKYLDAHEACALTPVTRFDRLLVALARTGGIGLAIADSYSGVLYRTATLRAKLVATLAILECSPPSYAVFDRPDQGGALVFLRMGASVAANAVLLLCGALFLLPAQIVLKRGA